jgi:hypothetical protein
MNFGRPYRTINEPHAGNAFQLPQAPRAVLPAGPRAVADAPADGDGLDLSDLAGDLKVHQKNNVPG